MSTVNKALDILDLFSRARPTIGLSEASRLLKRDKASTLRYLSALEKNGFVEQDPVSRSYYLGPAVARLSLIREATYPINKAARNVLKALVEETGETAHLSHFSHESLSEIAIEETSNRSTRVYIDPAEPLTFHATASGIAYLSQCSEELARKLLTGQLEAHTPDTMQDPEEILAQVRASAEQGYATSHGTFEAEVCGIAAPVFGPSNEVCGAVAVATPESRMTPEIETNIAQYVMVAAEKISQHYGAKKSLVTGAG